MIDEFLQQDEEYQAYLAAGPAFVCNDFGDRYRRGDRGDGNMLNRAGPATGGAHTSVRKVCSRDLNELMTWLGVRFGAVGPVPYRFREHRCNPSH